MAKYQCPKCKEDHPPFMLCRLGATGKFPEGKLNADDEGELQFAIAADKKNKVVIIDFGKEVAWLGMPKDVAIAFANSVLEKAEEL